MEENSNGILKSSGSILKAGGSGKQRTPAARPEERSGAGDDQKSARFEEEGGGREKPNADPEAAVEENAE